jgi:hypothetical protein
LDPPFFYSNENKWKWPSPQDPAACKQLLIDSTSITYLEHSAATIYFTNHNGPRTCLKIFGSPYSPGRRGWAFQYWGEDEASKLWDVEEMDGVDVVITHTPAHGHVDKTTVGDMTGCEVLKRRLGEVRPMMHVCGHIHDGRGVERVRWKTGSLTTNERRDDGVESRSKTTSVVEPEVETDSLVESVEYWKDPGAGNKKISLVDLTKKGGRGMEYAYTGQGVPRHIVPERLRALFEGQTDKIERAQPDALEPHATSSLEDGALHNEAGVESWAKKAGGAIEWRNRNDIGRSKVDAEAVVERSETLMINAAFLGQRVVGRAPTFNKPIVVDVELPVWHFDSEVEPNVQ